MGTHRLSFDEFLNLPEEPGKHYELNQGELVVEASPTLKHNVIRSRIAALLDKLVKAHGLGLITVENDFRLDREIVRNPDVAFITNEQLRVLDPECSPMDGAPTLAVEVISPNNSAEDMLLKVHQYLKAGSKAVWVVYPALELLVVHDTQGVREFQKHFEEHELFGGIPFTLPLDYVFDPNLTR
jgi:Uma2 family endonuclease